MFLIALEPIYTFLVVLVTVIGFVDPDMASTRHHYLFSCPPPKVSGDILVSMLIPSVGVGVTVCIYHISLIIWWNFTRLAWIRHWDKPYSYIRFGDLTPILGTDTWGQDHLDHHP